MQTTIVKKFLETYFGVTEENKPFNFAVLRAELPDINPGMWRYKIRAINQHFKVAFKADGGDACRFVVLLEEYYARAMNGRAEISECVRKIERFFKEKIICMEGK